MAHPPLGWCGELAGWAAVQVLWSHPGPGPVRVAVRFRVAARTSDGRDRLFATVAARLIADWYPKHRPFRERSARPSR